MKPLPLVLLFASLFHGMAASEERMNGMIGAFYGTSERFSLEYDLILQFQESKEWMGNISGAYLSEEVSLIANKAGAGFIIGKREREQGTVAVSSTVFLQSRWRSLTDTEAGAELKLTWRIFGAKIGLMEDKSLFYAIGISY